MFGAKNFTRNYLHILNILTANLFIFVLAACSNLTPTPETVIPTPVPPIPTAEVGLPSLKSAYTDEEVFHYQFSVITEYEQGRSLEESEALSFIDGSDHFDLPLVTVFVQFNRHSNKLSGIQMSDEELIEWAIERFEDIGFEEKDGQWYFDGQQVNMGNPLE